MRDVLASAKLASADAHEKRKNEERGDVDKYHTTPNRTRSCQDRFGHSRMLQNAGLA